MQTYQWSDQLSVGVKEIDDQHKILVELLSDLQKKLLQKVEDREILAALHSMQKYAQVHFALEEELMLPIQHKLDNYDLHISEHRNFEDTVHGLIFRFVQEGHAVAWQLFIFLGDWLVRHIQQTDVVLGKQLSAQK